MLSYRLVSVTYLQKWISVETKKGPVESTSFSEGDYVLISYPNGRPNKLHHTFKGPYIIVERKKDGYICQDLNTLNILSVVHGSRLKRYKSLPNSDEQSLIDVACRDNDEHIIGSILSHNIDPRKYNDVIEFKIRWLGCEPSEDEWLYFLDAYIKEHPELQPLNRFKRK